VTKDKAWAEWPTVMVLAACYGLWVVATTVLWEAFAPGAFVVLAVAIAWHSSVQHEALHGHPFRDARLNAALVFPALGLLVPYGRFRDTHLAHHLDAVLTDPYDDPETNYHDPAVWAAMPRWRRAVLEFNNTLLGRLVVGPAVGMAGFLSADLRAIRRADRKVLVAWLWHGPAVAVAVLWVWWAAVPGWAWLVACYAAMSLLKIRTFLEHQAHERVRGRTVVIEDRGPLAWLFLNNNYHVVHHMHPRVPWYRLPGLYAANRERYLARNEGYAFRSYAEVFRRFFLRAKDPVPHPFYRPR
jgi:fatty acid desaturase